MSSQFANSKEISNVNRTLSNALTAMQVTEPWLQQKHVIYGKQQIKEGEIKRVFITWRKWYWWYNSIADECFNFFFLGNISQTTKRFSQWTLLMLTLFIFYKALSWSWSYHLDIFFFLSGLCTQLVQHMPSIFWNKKIRGPKTLIFVPLNTEWRAHFFSLILILTQRASL